MLSMIASRRLTRRHVLLVGLLGGLAFALLSTGSARAALISTDACDNSTLTQPFLPWGDASQYKLVPGGDFEGSLAGWTLTGGARTVPGSEPFGATGSAGSNSLYLPAGATAQSPFTCVDAAYPTFRLFGRNDSLLSTVAVQVVYKEPLLGQVAVPVGTIALGGSWQPTLPFLTASAVQGLVSGLVTGNNPQVALRFTALLGPSQIDDVYVDPHMSH